MKAGFGLPTILGVVFIVLKLTKTISWSWLWVLSPFWIGALFYIALIVFVIYSNRDVM